MLWGRLMPLLTKAILFWLLYSTLASIILTKVIYLVTNERKTKLLAEAHLDLVEALGAYIKAISELVMTKVRMVIEVIKHACR